MGFICSLGFSFVRRSIGFHYFVSFVLLVSPSPRLCLVFIIGFICSPGFSFVRLRLGFIIRFALVLLVSPSPRLCLVFIMGFIGGWELCQYRWTNCYESQEDEGADIKGEP
jgi:hypothetical protein